MQEVISQLGDSSDQRFRLKYILPEENSKDFAAVLQETLLPLLESRQNEVQEPSEGDHEEPEKRMAHAFELIGNEIESLQENIYQVVVASLARHCPDVQLSSNTTEFVLEGLDSEAFIGKLKSLLSSQKDCISPLIEYARIQGATLVPMELISGMELYSLTVKELDIVRRRLVPYSRPAIWTTLTYATRSFWWRKSEAAIRFKWKECDRALRTAILRS